jgi:hypothetical protein
MLLSEKYRYRLQFFFQEHSIGLQFPPLYVLWPKKHEQKFQPECHFWVELALKASSELTQFFPCAIEASDIPEARCSITQVLE